MMVPNEEQEQKRNNASNSDMPVVSCFSSVFKSSVASASSSSTKKNKHKIPQRGLGVAQLERLRLEELQKRNERCSVVPFSKELSLVDQKQICCNVTKTENMPFVSGNSLPFSSSMALGMDLFVPAQNQGLENSAVALTGRSCNNGVLPGVWSQMAPCKRNSESSNLNSSNILQTWQPPIELTNISMNVVNSSKTTELVCTPMEPPSNQNYGGSRYDLLTCWRGREKDREFNRDQQMAVEKKKRSWPFQVDSLISQQPPYPCKVPSLCNSYVKTEEIIPSCGNAFVDTEMFNCAFKISNSSFNLESRNCELQQGRNTRENGVVVDSTIGTALCLTSALPTTVNSMGNSVNVLHSNEKPFYRFLPSRTDSYRTSSPEQKGDTVDGLDLSLKL